MKQPRANPWIAFRKPRPRPRLRLFCYSYAGGGASVFRTWQAELPDEIEVCPVQLPGRENRLSQERYRRVAPLTAALCEALEPLLDLPFAFFGHSLGAIIAYETALRLRDEWNRSPVCLLASARRAPHIPPDDRMYQLPDDEFRTRLRELEGTPAEVLEHPELMELMEPLLRADFELNDTYEPSDGPPLECPLTVFGGLTDPDVSRENLEAWREVTRGAYRLRMFPGGHFYLHEQRPALMAAIAQDLMPHLSAR